MLLALDVGNTNITGGVFDGRRLARRFRLETDAGMGEPALAMILARGVAALGIDAAVLGSVVPEMDSILADAVRRTFRCQTLGVGPRSDLGIRLKVRKPNQVGADRIMNALAAHERAAGPAVVMDLGTATTFDCVARNGDYLGGAILPGPNLAAAALRQGTAKLPLVKVRRPDRVIGKDTVECIRAGLYFGYLGMIEKVLRLTIAEMRRQSRGRAVRVLATGGLSPLFKDDLPGRPSVVPDLTLEGLRIAFERLTGKGG